ncbi:MAG: M3 family oligoendopeptidase [Ardenticatenaceae bacterium]|nr:M3 family oligoendopeptidase [Anaerolineales bacterium]MCB8921832.1 M3 family oligoendopeptidase [Ardenticatenaceae bacterium]MCB8991010.1 M3 family oligoendopeptidase [Ardenticatenaceae bacterium]MCB9005310.1 M3 family oligoendopeptidase [Ardenticatenaceae bacterium]
MFDTLPTTAQAFMDWPWEKIEPYYAELAERPLTPDTVHQWLLDWSSLTKLVSERFSRLHVAKTIDTTDEAVEKAFNDFLETVFLAAQSAEQTLNVRLLQSGLEPDNMAVPLSKIRADVEIFREENLPLMNEEKKLDAAYDKIIGAQTIEWAGEERTLTGLKPFFNTPDRAVREQIWRQKSARQLQDREAINANWRKLIELRIQQAANAGFGKDYRAFRWQMLKRFAYTPEDSKAFAQAIEEVVVPAASRIYAQYHSDLGVESLRPWDVDDDKDLLFSPPLRPYENPDDLDAKAAAIFQRVDPQLGSYFETMRSEKLLDLPNRKGKAPGGYCTAFPVAQRPFIFMNAIGSSRDVTTMLHEAGHAFHVFERTKLPYVPQMRTDMEFNEVASMAMELLSAPYLAAGEGGYYSEVDAARHRIQHLQKIIHFWPYMAVVDLFQHWVYENMEAALDAANCDAVWADLWRRYMPGIDWDGFADEMATGWQRKQHIHGSPFYYVEYGMAQVGAIQVWRNALNDQAGAVARYRQALAKGGTVTLPELYETAGATFAFTVPVMQEAVALLEKTIAELEATLP